MKFGTSVAILRCAAARNQAAPHAQGGPGCASSGGGFLREHGPWFPNAHVQDNGLRRNEFSWNRAASVIYLDQPAYTGFSYSNRSSDRYAGARRALPAPAMRGRWQACGSPMCPRAPCVSASAALPQRAFLTPNRLNQLCFTPCNAWLVLTSGRPAPSSYHTERSVRVQLHGVRVSRPPPEHASMRGCSPGRPAQRMRRPGMTRGCSSSASSTASRACATRRCGCPARALGCARTAGEPAPDCGFFVRALGRRRKCATLVGVRLSGKGFGRGAERAS
jgi:hypothetical protein